MPRSLLALKDRYERKKIENVSSDDQDEQEVDVEGDYGCEFTRHRGCAVAKDEAKMPSQHKKESTFNGEKEKSFGESFRKVRIIGNKEPNNDERKSESEKKKESPESEGNQHSEIFFKTPVSAIELGTWPKPVRCQSRRMTVVNKYHSLQSKPYRPWECDNGRVERHPVRPRASLPRNGFFAEFGHLGFREHWRRMHHGKTSGFEAERKWMYDHGLPAVDNAGSFGRNWVLSGGIYSGYLPPYRAELLSYPHECYSCSAPSRLGCLDASKKSASRSFEKQIEMAAQKFRQSFQSVEQAEAQSTGMKRPLIQNDQGTRKRGVGVYWPHTSNEKAGISQLKVQRTESTSPTFDCVTAEKAKEVQERPYSCTICDKSFKRRSSLATHKFIHTDLKPHVCDVCNKRFLRKSDLKKHGLMHSGKKPYQCEKCGRRFSQSSNMLTHLRRHMGIRPFECGICGRSFFRKVDLKRHEGRHMAKKLKTKSDGE